METGQQDRENLAAELERRLSGSGGLQGRARRALQMLLWLGVVQAAALGKRLADIVAALLMGAALLPAFLAMWSWSSVKGSGMKKELWLGRWAVPFHAWSFDLPDTRSGRILRAVKFHRIPLVFNILRGDMSLVGPRPLSPGGLSPAEHAMRRRYNVRPGLVCLWWIRSRANIAYGTEAEADAEYMHTRSVKGDLAIVLRALPAMLYGEGVASADEEIRMLGMRMDNLTMDEAIARILSWTGESEARRVCFLNADCMNIAYGNGEYRNVANSADLSLADGIGIKLAGKILRRDIRQNVNGTDLFPPLCAALEGAGRSIFLLGARPGIAEGVAEWVRGKCPGLRVAGVRDGYFGPDQEPGVIREIAQSGAHLLFVALGAPRQDIWVAEHMGEFQVPVAMGVGGLFDFYSGRIPRAPLWVREMGMEWVYRFIQEPRRMWRRYFVGNVVFLWRVVMERLRDG